MQKRKGLYALTLLSFAFSMGAGPALAQTAAEGDTDAADDAQREEILVWGRAIDLVGAADSASEGIVGFDDLSTRPLLRVGELVEVVPGLIATQHAGGADPFEVSFKYAKARLYSSPDLSFADSHVEEMKPYALKSWWNSK